MTETARQASSPVTHHAGFCSSTSDMVDQVVFRTREARARGQHMIALLNADVRLASASRLGPAAASDVDFRPQEWLATRSASAIIASCDGGSTRGGTEEPLAVLAQSPPATQAGNGATWHHSDRQFDDALAGGPAVPVRCRCRAGGRAACGPGEPSAHPRRRRGLPQPRLPPLRRGVPAVPPVISR